MKLFLQWFVIVFALMKKESYQEEEEVISRALFVHISAIRGLAHRLTMASVVKDIFVGNHV